MFRYGGPIKEGVMSGIREPRANGGRAALVGNPVYPQTGGREHHNILKTIFGWGVKPVLGAGTKQATKKTVGTETAKGIKSLWQKYGPTWPKATRTGKLGEGKGAWETGKGFKEIPIPKMERFGRFVKQNPWWTAGGVLYGGKPVLEAGKAIIPPVAKTIADVAVPDWIYNWETGRWFNPDDTDLKPGDKKILDEKITEKITEKIVPEVPQKSDEEIRAERIQRYRDIMDIKGMNSEAASKSLIEASRLINESQDFKGDIRSGSLINKIIQGASKAYDKPADMKRAIDTLIVKGEIEKDIKASDPSNAQLNALRIMQGKKLQRELNPSFDNLKAAFAKDNKGQSGIELAAGAYSKNNDQIFRGPLITKSDFKEILSNLKKDPNTKDVDEVSIIKTWTQGELDSSQKNIPDGNYTVGDKIVTIKDKQVVDVN
jgi:hypothetical protein